MQFLTCFVSADEDDLYSLAEALEPLNEWSGFSAPGVDTLKVATLHSVVANDSLHSALDLYEPSAVGGTEEQTLVLKLDPVLLDRLANVDEEDLEALAVELVETEAFEEEEIQAEDVLAFLQACADLAQLAESQDQVIFVWIHLLQD